jgi:hypothetical protein
VEATHVLLVEPILNPADELQAIGRVHRIGQTRQVLPIKLAEGNIPVVDSLYEKFISVAVHDIHHSLSYPQKASSIVLVIFPYGSTVTRVGERPGEF